VRFLIFPFIGRIAEVLESLISPRRGNCL